MKILHTADIHLGEFTGPMVNGENARLQDTVKCMSYLANKALDENVDAILISGDLFNKSKLWADQMLREITMASNWLRSLTNIAPTVLMFGTANHDNMQAFKNIRAMNIPGLTIITEPQLVSIDTKSGIVQVAAVPGMDKGFYRTLFPGMDMEDENKAISEALGNVILGVAEDADNESPLVLMSHYTVTGAQLENGEEIFLNSDIVIPTGALAASNYDLVCLGHIHKAQSIPNCGRPVYYSGPLNGVTFNEEGQDKGFWIHEFSSSTTLFEDKPKYINSKFIKTPSREFLTINWGQQEIETFINLNVNDWSSLGNNLKDKIIRVIYSCSDELNKQFNKKSLEKALYDAGAFYVSEIRPSKILTTTDKNSMNENDSVENNLRLWLEKQEATAENITKIIEISQPMIAQVSASLSTGKLSGIFEPVALEVKNYRSYKEESFDFTKVSFATVNGPNGIGKSSFFMDAIADCLYEEPREGELTGWISNDDNCKSGAITFEFLMGSEKWRVIRTRAKSGKATLALQKWDKDKWADYSGDKKDQTQEKIVSLLGMDSLTFKSCALIMQDNYGLFLEADKTERMQVLGNILGLSIYDRLHDLAKDELRIQKRKIDNLKLEISNLDEKLVTKDILQNDINILLEKKEAAEKSINEYQSKLENIKNQLEHLKELKIKVSNLTEKIMSIFNDIEDKNKEVTKLQDNKNRAQNIVNQEEKILSKIAEYEETRDKITMFKAKLPLINEKNKEFLQIESETEKTIKDLLSKNQMIKMLEDKLQYKYLLEDEVKKLDTFENDLKVMDKIVNEIYELSKQLSEKKQQLLTAEKTYDTKYSSLVQELNNCTEKSQLISNSKCPLDNPSCNFLKDAIEARNRIPDLKNSIAELNHKEIDKLNDEILNMNNQLKAIQYDSTIHQSLKTDVSNLQKKKEQLSNLNIHEQLLKNHLEQRAELEKKLESLEEKQKSIKTKLDSLKDEVKDLSTLEAMMSNLEKWYKGKDELPAAKQLLDTSNERLQVLEAEIALKNKEIENLEIERDKFCDEKQSITVTEDEKILTDEKVIALNNYLSAIKVDIGITQSKLNELESLSKTRDEKLEEIKDEANITNILELLVKAFSIDGIPFQIVRSVVNELSSKSNEILSQMTGGKMSIEFKMDKVLKNKKEVNALEIWINDYQRGTMPYLSRSGGQKVKAALSVAFALADLKANRAGIQLGMMFIDEPPFLDGEGVQAYCDALQLMSERYPSMRVVAISHDPAMKARFPQEIEVIDTESGSKIIFKD